MGRDEKLNPFAKSSVVDLGATVLDRLHRPLDPGDEVLVTGIDLSQMLWKVQTIGPVVDPRAPSNAVRILMLSPLVLLVRAREPSGNLMRVRTQEETGEEAHVSKEVFERPESPVVADVKHGWYASVVAGLRRWKG